MGILEILEVLVVIVIVLLIFAGYFSEMIVLILIILISSFIADYSVYKEKEAKKYCVYFPNTEICKAIDKNPGYLTKKQKDKMIQRVEEEDIKRKDLKKVQDIEVE